MNAQQGKKSTKLNKYSKMKKQRRPRVMDGEYHV